MRKKRPKMQRRPARKWWSWRPGPRLLRIGGGVMAAAAIAAPCVYLGMTGLPPAVLSTIDDGTAQAVRLSSRLGLSVQEIFVEGRSETSPGEVLDVLDVTRGTPILIFDPAHAKAELEKLPWIKSVAIERRLPDTLYVTLNERQPLALWQRHGALTLIDREGVEIRGTDIERFSHLPVVVGDDAPQHAANLIDLLATEPDLEQRVTAAIRVGMRRWNLRFDLGEGRNVEVQLPEVNAAAAWSRLAEIERASGLLERNITRVDLRLADRMVVQVIREVPPPAPPKRGARNDKKPA